MDKEQCLAAFKDLAERLDIDIRYTSEGPSGLCMLRGVRVFFWNRDLDTESLVRTFVRDFRTLDLESCFVLPVIRELLGREANGPDWKTE